MSTVKPHALSFPLAANSWLGVLGGGQLGAFFVRAAQNLGFRTVVFCPYADAPAMRCADISICAPYHHQDKLTQFAEQCHAITTEFENVPATTLRFLATKTRVVPDAHVLQIAQNRLLEKKHFQNIGLTTTPFIEFPNSHSNLPLTNAQHEKPNDLFPAILKTATLGYDGKGQWEVHNWQEAQQRWQDYLKDTPNGTHPSAILEKKQHLQFEFSLIVARNHLGNSVYYPAGENHHKNGILDMTIVPALEDNSTLLKQAQNAVHRLTHSLNYVGVMGVEFFVTGAGLLINEIAPRPHNSGHYTLDACQHSQFDQQVRILANWPLADPTPHAAAIMVNILGDRWYTKNDHQITIREPNWQPLLQSKNLTLYLYGKDQPNIKRKMGHFTIIGQEKSELMTQLKMIHSF